ncbi:hypothetical protein GCM10017744_061880 [Streptomyces antimycoticus]
MAAQNATHDDRTAPRRDGGDGVRDREIRIEQTHLDRVYHRLEEKIHEAEFLMDDAAKRGQVGTPGRSPNGTPRSSGPGSTSTG